MHRVVYKTENREYGGVCNRFQHAQRACIGDPESGTINERPTDMKRQRLLKREGVEIQLNVIAEEGDQKPVAWL